MAKVSAMGSFSIVKSRSSSTHLAVLMVLLIMLLLLECSSVCHGWHKFTGRTTVTVRNDISENTPLTIHCKSKEDDLGEHQLSYNQSFTWKFQPNFWGTTLFWCNFGWYDNTGRLVQGGYQVYTTRRDEVKCFTNCVRSVRSDGVYGNQNFSAGFVKMYEWPK